MIQTDVAIVVHADAPSGAMPVATVGTKGPLRQFSISLCTTCMGRLSDLIQTLPQNLEDSASYPRVEFLLLDYNSRDGLEDWVRQNLGSQIESGRVTYARTCDPQWYSMSHSRNLAFRLARSEIVCNVDADNWIGAGFLEKVNELANEQPSRAIFIKGKQLLRGRLGFFKDEWEKLLGGYDEDLEGYGHDDRDLVVRAQKLGFRMKFFGGKYVTRLKTSGSNKVMNMRVKDWRRTEKLNKELSEAKINRGLLMANAGRPWGAGHVTVNFREEIRL
jgi:glycosyltransferase involved in cell wall biosynthesis